VPRGVSSRVACIVCALLAIPALALPATAAAAKKSSLDVAIKRTAYGIPHITAKTYEGAGYGYGYALAQDNICELADTYLTVRAERSRHFGPGETYASRGNGANFRNGDSDAFFQRMIDTKIVENMLAKAPPEGPLPVVKETVRGYVKGYNRYLADVGGTNGINDPRCKGKEWVKPIEEIDAYRRFWQLGILASQGVAIDGIANAGPPTTAIPLGGGSAASAPDPVLLDELNSRLGEQLGIGSNAYGVGRDGTRSGGGIVLGNPHFPWDGPERFWQAHITIPGKVNVSGGSLFGVPAVLIGHTDGMGWSHTVSTARRFVIHELKLVPGAPTSYFYDGQIRQMKADKVTIQVKDPDGVVRPVTRTLYSSHHGSILTSILGLPVFPWTFERAYAMGDVNAGNFRYLNHFFETNRAQSVRQLDAIERKYQGIPWVNTIAADRKGEAYYADIGAIPHLTNEQLSQCEAQPVGTALRTAAAVFATDGSRSACEWGTDPDAVVPGILGYGKLPKLFRRDWVLNSNDSYWLTNPAQPLEGYDQIIGNERTARALRTRVGIRIAQQRLDGSDGRPGRKFTLSDMTWAVFNNRQYAGELWRDELVAMCKSNPMMPSSNGPVNVSEACPVLENWNLRDDLDSKGAILARRFISRARAVQGGPYRNGFNVNDPVNTPNGLNTDSPAVRQALGDAVADLRGANIPLDAPLRGFQYEKRGELAIPIHGGPGSDGVFNAINVSWTPNGGYPNVPHGSSFVQVVHFPPQRKQCAQHRTILTYSQSTNPESPYFGDQTRLFSKKRWVNSPFCAAQVKRAKGTTLKLGPGGARR
jgi:acyl-homoserine-lactone acylase